MHLRVEGWMAAGCKPRGKSGLLEAMVPGNARAGKPDGKRHREQTAVVSATVRVKRWSKSPPGSWQQFPHGKPHLEQCQIGISRGFALRAASVQKSGLAARGRLATGGQDEWSSSPGSRSGMDRIRLIGSPRVSSSQRQKGKLGR